MLTVSNQNDVYCIINNWCICIDISCVMYVWILAGADRTILVFCMYIHRTCIPDRANRYRAREGDIIISPQGFVTVKLREAAPGQSSASDSILHSDSIHIFLEHACRVCMYQ